MSVKIDTKQKFTVLTPEIEVLPVNVAESIFQKASEHLSQETRNIIVNLSHVTFIEDEAANLLAALHQQFYQQHASFVLCELQPAVRAIFQRLNLLQQLNITNTESEAWDIIQMEEIEREFFDNEEKD